MSWRKVSLAPTCQFGRYGAEVVVRYIYAGEARDIRLPGIIWVGLLSSVRAGRIVRLNETWTPWLASGGRARQRAGYVELGYGYLFNREERIPGSVWEQITAAMRSGGLEPLPSVDAAELEA
ncbi:conserved hypothetical protein [Frankia canadensis]|uniref:Uncharacterized protein n=1 Tax=Frankia canadensis TaxID=1836972 RepID=A0A2I2KN01_9ACTN|nr:conserved hypothetical protein [Frankia canadensis]SOU54330.1 conserved hypothetical protein [Frankia canadensis]